MNARMTSVTSLQHPFRVTGGRWAHDLDPIMFDRWLKREGISEYNYWKQLGAEQDLTKEYGKSILTHELGNDQRGWAKQRFPEHYRSNGARWYIRKDKPAVPIPAIKLSKNTQKKRRHS